MSELLHDSMSETGAIGGPPILCASTAAQRATTAGLITMLTCGPIYKKS